MRQSVRIVSLLALVVIASPAQAGPTTFPGETSFAFSGTLSDNTPILTVCAMTSFVCHSSIGDLIGSAVVARSAGQLQAGAVVRGDIAGQDPSGSATYHAIELDLNTQNFFSQNPGAHIAISPRSLLPHQVNGVPYNNYPPYQLWPGTSTKVPYAYGDGVIIGSVPCKQSPGGDYFAAGTNLANGIAQEIFLRPEVSGHDTTACASGQLVFEDNTLYRVKVLVKQEQCPHKNALCRWIGYRFQKVPTGPVFGGPPSAKGGFDASPTQFIDDTAPAAVFGGGPTQPPAGWTALKPADVSSWFISNIFTSSTSPSWSFLVTNVQVTASNTLPAWWNASSL